MKQRNVLLLIRPANPERNQGIARFAKSHGWHLTIVDRLARFPRGWRGDGALVTSPPGNQPTPSPRKIRFPQGRRTKHPSGLALPSVPPRSAWSL